MSLDRRLGNLERITGKKAGAFVGLSDEQLRESLFTQLKQLAALPGIVAPDWLEEAIQHLKDSPRSALPDWLEEDADAELALRDRRYEGQSNEQILDQLRAVMREMIELEGKGDWYGKVGQPN